MKVVFFPLTSKFIGKDPVQNFKGTPHFVLPWNWKKEIIGVTSSVGYVSQYCMQGHCKKSK